MQKDCYTKDIFGQSKFLVFQSFRILYQREAKNTILSVTRVKQRPPKYQLKWTFESMVLLSIQIHRRTCKLPIPYKINLTFPAKTFQMHHEKLLQC